MTTVQKPFLKWVGGKTQHMTSLLERIPSKMHNYYEPFIGGGSVLFAILSLQREQKITISGDIYANDLNTSLINTYKQIQQQPEEVFNHLNCTRHTYDSITGVLVNREATNLQEALSSKESYYYWIRRQYNHMSKDTVQSAALFVFLNKTCFRGIYREGPHGFNVPYGHYKKTPNMITRDELLYISELMQHVIFTCTDYMNALTHVEMGDFVYLDPPYAPEKEKSFVGYTVDGFDLKNHQNLFSRIQQLHHSGVQFLMSNANVDIVTETLQSFSKIELKSKRTINSKNPQATTVEVLIFN